MKLQIVGLPLAAHRRMEAELRAWIESQRPQHDVRPTPSKDRSKPVIDQAEIRDIMASVQEGFVHPMVVPTRWHPSLRVFRYDCRLAFLQIDGDFEVLEWGALRQALDACIGFEVRWANVIQPPDLRHPLLLPPPCFSPVPAVGDFWRLCDTYGNTATIGEAHDTIQKVIATHRRQQGGIGSYWEDHRSRRFVPDHSGHGLTPEERAGNRRFRFCFEVPRGFHYDVTHTRGCRFEFFDSERNHHLTERAKVDPWGRVR